MRLLLDTHTFLWLVLNDPRLPGTTRSLLADPNNNLQLSPASLWEIAIKISTGRYQLPEPFGPFMEETLARNVIRLLPIEVAHAEAVASLPLHHKDPFDRMLVAQALVERVPIVSVDAALDAYGVTRLW